MNSNCAKGRNWSSSSDCSTHMQLIAPARKELPSWTGLTWNQCPHCPLKLEQHPHCPIAANLADIISSFEKCLSFEEAEITVRTEAREYRQKLPLQYGVGSLMGIYMVTSGCPVMDKLRPMVFTHLPFATVEETVYRAISMYLLAQYYVHRRGRKPDWDLKNLVKIYEDVSQVNKSFTKRLLSINTKDANLNALFNLDCFANFAVLSITEGGLDELEPLFQPYLEEKGRA